MSEKGYGIGDESLPPRRGVRFFSPVDTIDPTATHFLSREITAGIGKANVVCSKENGFEDDRQGIAIVDGRVVTGVASQLMEQLSLYEVYLEVNTPYRQLIPLVCFAWNSRYGIELEAPVEYLDDDDDPEDGSYTPLLYTVADEWRDQKKALLAFLSPADAVSLSEWEFSFHSPEESNETAIPV